ncbi:MAG: hypothetical protein N2593_01380 [Patescibacteria group bacterium]|nr:hypothetical protein [Patescibacteria group bacterium]
MLNWLFSNTPLVFFIQSLWRDEAFSYLISKKNIIEILFLTAKDFNPPLYYIILHFWIKIFGYSEIVLRSLSLIFYLGIIYVSFLFLNEIFKFKTKKSFFYLIFFIINPSLLYYAFEARMYSMFAFFSLLSFYSLLKKNKKIYLLSTILGLYTHYFMIFVISIQYFIFKSKNQINAFLSFLPWILFLFLNKNIFSSSFWIKNISLKESVNFLGNIYTGYEYDLNFFNNQINKISVFLILIIFSIFFLKFKNKSEKKVFKILIIWGFFIPLLIFFISFIKPVFLSRYLIFSTIGLLFLITFIIEKHSFLIKTIIIFLLFFLTLNYNKIQIKERKKANLRKTIKEIKSLIKKDDFFYVVSELDFFIAQYYLNEDQVYIWQKNYQEIPDYVGKVLIHENKIKYNLPLYPKKAFILEDSNLNKYSIQSIY